MSIMNDSQNIQTFINIIDTSTGAFSCDNRRLCPLLYSGTGGNMQRLQQQKGDNEKLSKHK
jgi:hypothetical protein